MVIIKFDDCLKRLRDLIEKVLAGDVDLSNLDSIEYHLMMISKFIAVKEVYMVKGNGSKIYVDCAYFDSYYLDMCIAASKFNLNDAAKSKISRLGVDITNLPSEYVEKEQEIINGILVLQAIRNCINHGSFDFCYDEESPEKSYLHLRIVDNRKNVIEELDVPFSFFENYLNIASNKSEKDFGFVKVKKDTKVFDNDSSVIINPISDNKSDVLPVDDILSRIDNNLLAGLFTNLKTRGDQDSKNLSKLITLATSLDVDINALLFRENLNMDDPKSEKSAKEAINLRLEDLLKSLSEMLGPLIVDRLRTVTIYSYANLLFSSKEVITDPNVIPNEYGLISTKGLTLRIHTSYNDGQNEVPLDKGEQYIKKIINIISEINKYQNITPDKFHKFVMKMVELLKIKNALLFSRLRNSVDHFNVNITNIDGRDMIILKDLKNQNNNDSAHFIGSSELQDFYLLLNSYLSGNGEKFTLEMLFEELILAVKMIPKGQIKSVDPTISDEAIDQSLENIKLIRQSFIDNGVDLNLDVLDYCPELRNGLSRKR